MGIVDEDIARVRAATDFTAVVGEHLSLRRVGTRWVGLCPFHTEKSPSFSVNAELGVYYCFGCGAKGDAITFVREIEHLDFTEAVEKLAGRAGITLRYDNSGGGHEQRRRTRLTEALEAAISWYHDRLLSARDAGPARAYLRGERGYGSDDVRRYRLGWAPAGRDILVRSSGIPVADLVDSGLAVLDGDGAYSDFFRGRLLFPIFDAGGKAVGAGGRLLPGGRGPKYKNTANTAVYDKSRILYGLNWAKKSVVEKGRVVVCEGYTDVIGLQRAGVEEAVATCGTSLADGHVKLLTNFARQVVLAYDADGAGRSAADRFYDWEQRFGIDIRVLDLPAGTDPADLARSDPDGLRAAVEGARPFLGYRLERLFEHCDLSTPENRSRAASAAMALVAEHPDVLVRDAYLMQVADRCRIDPERLRSLPLSGPAGGSPSGGGAPAPSTFRAAGAVPAAGRSGSGLSGRGSGSGSGSGSPGRGGAGQLGPVGPEREALRLAVSGREGIAGRLALALFRHPLGRRAFDALQSAPDLHQAMESADPQTSELLGQIAVEDSDADPDDVVVRLIELAVNRHIRELQADMRQAPPDEQAGWVPVITWLKTALMRLRFEQGARSGESVEAEEALVAWLVEREAAVV